MMLAIIQATYSRKLLLYINVHAFVFKDSGIGGGRNNSAWASLLQLLAEPWTELPAELWTGWLGLTVLS